jgi:hypothetical protein
MFANLFVCVQHWYSYVCLLGVMVLPHVSTLTAEIWCFLTVEKWSLSLVARLNDVSIADGITS